MIRCLICTVFLMSMPAASLAADDEPQIHMIAPAWGMTLAADGTGFYNDLASLLLDLPSGQVKYDIQPYRRTRRHFYMTPGACIFPFSIKYLMESGDDTASHDLIESEWRLSTMAYLFAKPGQQAVPRHPELAGKRVAYPMGAQTLQYFKGTGADFIAVEKEEDKARMLLSGRVDYIAANLPDAKFVFDKLGVSVPPYNPNAAFSETGIHIVCQHTPANERFVDWYNHRQAQLIDDGTLDRFFEVSGLVLKDYLHLKAFETKQ